MTDIFLMETVKENDEWIQMLDFCRLATKLGIPSFIQLGILSADFGLGEFFKGRSMHWEFPVTSVRSHNFGSERHYPECPGGHSLIKVTRGGSATDLLPKAVQQLKMLPRAGAKNHIFGTLAWTSYPILMDRWNKNG